MKKALILLLTLVLIVSLTSCGKTENGSEAESAPTVSSSYSVRDVLSISLSESLKGSARLSHRVELDDSSAWLGLCPAGRDYLSEEEAEEAAIVRYTFEMRPGDSFDEVPVNFGLVEDGTYALVVATSDEPGIGYVVIQVEMTKTDNRCTFRYEDGKINERP